jgi:beta-glucosidase
MSNISSTYRDPDIPVGERVTDLIERMTLEEKVGQLVGTYVGDLHGPQDVDDVIDIIDDTKVGSVAPFGWGGAFHDEMEEAVEIATRLQTYAREETRLGIPLLFTCDAIHGHAYLKGATVFPNNLGIAATWDPDLVERSAEITARELRATGIKQNYGPTCDVARDPRWGRTGETFGESPYLVGELAARKVRGYQGDGLGAETVAATAKHFPAYSDPKGGEDAGPVDVSEHTLREVFLPPFERVLDEDVATVMPCYNSVDGEPVHGSHRFLTELLRDELGFDGFVASDWDGVPMLDEEHLTTRSLEMSVWQT